MRAFIRDAAFVAATGITFAVGAALLMHADAELTVACGCFGACAAAMLAATWRL